MRLTRYGYSELEGTSKSWAVEPFQLDAVNLFVGPNASGKSRILNTMHGLTRALSGSTAGVAFQNGSWTFSLSGDSSQIDVVLDIADGTILRETLTENGVLRLSRQADGAGRLWFAKQNQMVEISMPTGNFAIVSRRDRIQHPFLEPIFEWAKQTKYFQFSTDLGRQTLHLIKPHEDVTVSDMDSDVNPAFDPNAVVKTYNSGYEMYGDPFDEAILADMSSVGYDLERVASVHAKEIPFIAGQLPVMLAVKERDLQADTKQFEMSTGMFRALATIIHLNFQVMGGASCTFLIDDIGEGLDFKKSQALVDLIIAKASSSNQQVIMTSNDRFVMNEVDINFWHVVHREGQKISVKDRHNSNEIFEDFKYLGMSNFDFFATKAYLGQSFH